MQVVTYWNHAPTTPDANGVAWVGSSGPTDSIAIGGGGWGSVNTGSPFATHGDPDASYPLVASKPDPDNTGATYSWKIGFAAPKQQNGSELPVGHCFVIVLEGL